MKNSLLVTVLTWILAAGLILAAFFSIKFFFQTKEMRNSQFAMQRYQTTHQVLNVLLGDVVEYSKRDPGITPLLESIGVRMGKNAAGATINKPSGK